MATDITLHALATETTTTVTESRVQPYEADTVASSTPVDLGDNRACSVELVTARDDSYAYAILEVTLETSESSAAGAEQWREVGKFDRVNTANQDQVRQRISCTTDRYLRARYRVAKGYEPRKGGVKFSVLGRAT